MPTAICRIGFFILAMLAGPTIAQAQSAPTVIKLAPYLGGAWSFEAEIGGATRRFLLDTGGGISVVTPETATAADCQPWGQMTGFRMRGDRVDMMRCDDLRFKSSSGTIQTPTAGVFDFAKLLPPGAPPLGGSIALDSFAGRIVTIDLANERVVLETRESLRARVAGATEVKMRLAREMAGRALVPFVAVKTPRGLVWLQLDTGSDAFAVIADHTADLLSMRAGTNDRQRLSAELVGGVPLVADAVRVAPLIIDGNIGSPMLKKWVITLDLADERVWIAPSVGLARE